MEKKIAFHVVFHQPMVSELTLYLEKNPIFSLGKQKLADDWILAEANSTNFDDYQKHCVYGVALRCLFLGMFLEKCIDDKQMCNLEYDFDKPIRIKVTERLIKEKEGE